MIGVCSACNGESSG